LGFWIGFEWGNPKSKKIQTKKIFPKTQKISKKSKPQKNPKIHNSNPNPKPDFFLDFLNSKFS
jgi:hypothetical protein